MLKQVQHDAIQCDEEMDMLKCAEHDFLYPTKNHFEQRSAQKRLRRRPSRSRGPMRTAGHLCP